MLAGGILANLKIVSLQSGTSKLARHFAFCEATGGSDRNQMSTFKITAQEKCQKIGAKRSSRPD